MQSQIENHSKHYIYLYYIDKNLVYIGKATTNPYNRFYSHCKEAGWNNYEYVNKIDIIELENQTEMEMLEHYLIMRDHPRWNTKDIEQIEPQLEIRKIPNAISYDRTEFLRVFSNNSSIVEVPRCPYDFSYPSSKESLLENCTGQYDILVYYEDKELLFVDNPSIFLKRRQWLLYFKTLKDAGFDPMSVTRCEAYSFNTKTEAKIFYKYLIAKTKPTYMKYSDYYKDDISFELFNLPKPKIQQKRWLKDNLKQFQDVFDTLEQKIAEYNKRNRQKI